MTALKIKSEFIFPGACRKLHLRHGNDKLESRGLRDEESTIREDSKSRSPQRGPMMPMVIIQAVEFRPVVEDF